MMPNWTVVLECTPQNTPKSQSCRTEKVFCCPTLVISLKANEIQSLGRRTVTAGLPALELGLQYCTEPFHRSPISSQCTAKSIFPVHLPFPFHSPSKTFAHLRSHAPAGPAPQRGDPVAAEQPGATYPFHSRKSVHQCTRPPGLFVIVG